MWFTFARRSLQRHWRKSAVAILSVASACASLVLFEGYMVDVENMYVATFEKRQMLGHVVVERAGLASPGRATIDEGALDAAEQDALLSLLRDEGDFVRTVVRFLNFSGNVQAKGMNLGFTGLAHDVAAGRAMRRGSYLWNALSGRPFESDDEDSVLLGQGLADLLGCTWEGKGTSELHGPLGFAPVVRSFACDAAPFLFLAGTEHGQAGGERVDVAGLTATGFAELDDRLVMMPLALARRIVDTTRISFLTVELADPSGAPAFAARLREAALRRGLRVDARPWQDHAFGDLYVRTMEFLAIFRNFVLSIILVVAAMAVFSTFSKIVRERRKETATLRSMGFLTRDLVRLFALEAAVLGAAGALLGAAVAGVAIPVIDLLPITYKAGFLADPVPFRVAFSLPHVVLVAGLVVALAVLASVLAVWRGLKLSITEGLRYG